MTRILLFLGMVAIAQAQNVGDLIERGDVLDEKFRHVEALALYEQALAREPDNAVALQRIAKQYSQLMADTDSEKEQRDLGLKSIEYSKRAIEADPDYADGHLSLAICYGKVAFLESPRAQIEYSRLIKAEAEEAVRLDPSSDYGWHVLGRWNYELANFNAALRLIAQAIYGKFPDASNERAAECFEKAIALQPSRVIHHTELGRTYAELGRKDDARRELQKALSLPSREKDDEDSKKRARKALDRLQ